MQQDNPDAYLPGDRRRALAAGRELPEYVHGAALFADISGFTALGDSLATEFGAQRGAEELTAAVNRVFEPLLTTLDQYGGDVIFFSGDAVTGWIDGDDGRLALACALEMQQVMAGVSSLTTATGRPIRLGLKVAVAVGPARRFVVGDPRIQLIDVLAGTIMDRLAEVEHAAREGEVVADAGLVAGLGSLPVLADDDGRAACRVVRGLAEPVEPPAPRSPLPTLPIDVVRSWVLPRVFERITSGRGELFAELRAGAPLFMRFGGVDYDTDPDAPARLDGLVRAAQQVVDEHGGAVVQLTIGDKGAYLYAAFGALVAHEDDAPRACACALDLRSTATSMGFTDVAIGVTTGGLHIGTYGHPDRRAFCCFGDAVNLAARLMTAAPPGSIYVSNDVRRRAGSAFEWGESQQVGVRGKSAAVITSPLVGPRNAGSAPGLAAQSPLVGRERELAELRDLGTAAIGGRGQLAVLTGAAGVGKNRLLHEVAGWLAGRGARVRTSSARFYGARPSYGVWQDICRDAWSIPPDATTQQITARLNEVLTGVDPELVDRLPLLGPLVGVALPDSPLTATFDAKLRKASLESLMVQVIADSSRRAPLAYLINAETMDELSWDLFDTLRRSLSRLPVFVLIARRPEDANPFAGEPLVTEIVLGELGEDARRELIVSRLSGAGSTGVPTALVDRLIELAGGNPYHLEELVNHLVERGVDINSHTEVGLPTSLHSLQLARFDGLAEEPRRTLKVASVIGTRFATATIAGSYPELGDEREVGGHALALVDAALVVPERDELAEFLFRNAMIQHAAYETLTYGLRATLHDRVLGWLESHTPGGVDAALDLLAFHAARGTDDAKKRGYLVRAGQAAQAAYANDAAVGYYRDALPLVDEAERVDLFRRLGKVLELLGRWPDAEAAYLDAIAICAATGDVRGRAHAEVDLAEVNRKQARFDEASRLLAVAHGTFAEIGDQDGLAGVLHSRGTIASQQADYDAARTAYNDSLAIRRELGDQAKIGALLSNLAVVAEQLGEYDEARDLNEQALAVRERVGDPWAIAVSQNNLGMIALLQEDYERATAHIAESVRLAEKVGDQWVVAVGHHNNGNALRGLRRYPEAGTEFLAALRQYVDYDDRWSLALLVEDVLLLAADKAQAMAARQLLASADAIRAELEVPRPPAVAAQLDAALAGFDNDATHPPSLAVTSTPEIVDLIAAVCGLLRG